MCTYRRYIVNEKEAFYDQLEEVLARTGNQREITMGGINARTRKRMIMETNSLTFVGNSVYEFSTVSSLIRTYRQDTRHLMSIIDYIMIKQKPGLEYKTSEYIEA